MTLALFNALIGKEFLNDGDRYEGEYKDSYKDGRGKKEGDLLILTFFNAFIGKKFWKNGDVYEGEWKKDKISGMGRKFDLKGKILEEGIFEEGVLI